MNAESAGPVAGRKLTGIFYLAADSGKFTGDLRAEIRADLAELQAGMADAGPEMDCVAMFDDGVGGVQMDCKTGQSTPRLNVNMGSPGTLMEFLGWAMEWYPAENYALIIGSHGSGAKADPVYGVVDRASTTVAKSAQVGADRAIAFDDGAKSFLSIPELRRALEHGVETAGKPFAVVVFDACYMASLEVLQEMKQLADYVVASPEAVPGEGMPYEWLLNHWGYCVENGTSLAEAAIDVFRNFYKDTSETASLLAVDMAKVHVLALAMNILGNVLLLATKARPLVAEAIAKATRTSDPDFVYLYRLCSEIALAEGMPKALVDSAEDVQGAIGGAVSASWESGVEWGPTVFLSRGPVPAWYADLKVARTPWGEWVRQYVGS